MVKNFKDVVEVTVNSSTYKPVVYGFIDPKKKHYWINNPHISKNT